LPLSYEDRYRETKNYRADSYRGGESLPRGVSRWPTTAGFVVRNQGSNKVKSRWIMKLDSRSPSQRQLGVPPTGVIAFDEEKNCWVYSIEVSKSRFARLKPVFRGGTVLGMNERGEYCYLSLEGWLSLRGYILVPSGMAAGTGAGGSGTSHHAGSGSGSGHKRDKDERSPKEHEHRRKK